MRIEPCPGHEHQELPVPQRDAVLGWPIPAPGTQVLYRWDCLVEPVPAVVVAIEMDDPADVNVWQYGALVDNPNPVVELLTEAGETVRTRQIRWSRSAGYCLEGMDN